MNKTKRWAIAIIAFITFGFSPAAEAIEATNTVEALQGMLKHLQEVVDLPGRMAKRYDALVDQMISAIEVNESSKADSLWGKITPDGTLVDEAIKNVVVRMVELGKRILFSSFAKFIWKTHPKLATSLIEAAREEAGKASRSSKVESSEEAKFGERDIIVEETDSGFIEFIDVMSTASDVAFALKLVEALQGIVKHFVGVIDRVGIMPVQCETVSEEFELLEYAERGEDEKVVSEPLVSEQASEIREEYAERDEDEKVASKAPVLEKDAEVTQKEPVRLHEFSTELVERSSSPKLVERSKRKLPCLEAISEPTTESIDIVKPEKLGIKSEKTELRSSAGKFPAESERQAPSRSKPPINLDLDPLPRFDPTTEQEFLDQLDIIKNNLAKLDDYYNENIKPAESYEGSVVDSLIRQGKKVLASVDEIPTKSVKLRHLVNETGPLTIAKNNLKNEINKVLAKLQWAKTVVEVDSAIKECEAFADEVTRGVEKYSLEQANEKLVRWFELSIKLRDLSKREEKAPRDKKMEIADNLTKAQAQLGAARKRLGEQQSRYAPPAIKGLDGFDTDL